MIFSRRDFTLVMITLAVLLGGLTFLLVQPMVGQWQKTATARHQLERDRAVAQRLINTRSEWEGKLVGLRSTLPSYRPNEAVGADLLRQVRRLAEENGVVITRITPEEEKSIGDLYELAIEFSWEADLEPLVRFLFAVQVAGATLDIRQITMAPSQGSRLKGNAKIYFAYQRGEPEPVVQPEVIPEALPTEASPVEAPPTDNATGEDSP